MAPDPAFYFYAFPRSGSECWNLRPLVYRPSRVPFWASRPQLWTSKASDGSMFCLSSFWILSLIRFRIRIQPPNIRRIRNPGLYCFILLPFRIPWRCPGRVRGNGTVSGTGASGNGTGTGIGTGTGRVGNDGSRKREGKVQRNMLILNLPLYLYFIPKVQVLVAPCHSFYNYLFSFTKHSNFFCNHWGPL